MFKMQLELQLQITSVPVDTSRFTSLHEPYTKTLISVYTEFVII